MPRSDILREIDNLYARVPGALMANDLEHYLECGYIFSTPDYLLMGEELEEGWLIFIAAGKGALRAFVDHMPWWRDQIGWARHQRGREIHWYSTEKVLKLLGITYEDIIEIQKRH